MNYIADFRGKPACPCQAAWLPVYEAELQRRGALDGWLSIAQLIGGAPASGGTHTEGGASDFWPNGDVEVAVWVARQMGADATWLRPFNWDGDDGSAHVHSVLRGCVHNGPARYQIDAVDDGYNGLGSGGRGHPDDGPRPLSGRTWQEGIARAKEQGDDMPYTEKQLTDIVRAAVKAELADIEEQLKVLRKTVRQQVTTVRKKLDGPIEQLDEAKATLDAVVESLKD